MRKTERLRETMGKCERKWSINRSGKHFYRRLCTFLDLSGTLETSGSTTAVHQANIGAKVSYSINHALSSELYKHHPAVSIG